VKQSQGFKKCIKRAKKCHWKKQKTFFKH